LRPFCPCLIDHFDDARSGDGADTKGEVKGEVLSGSAEGESSTSRSKEEEEDPEIAAYGSFIL
jgi:hypothetical protein